MVRTLGRQFINNFAYLTAAQTRGGMLLAVFEDCYTLSDVHLSTNIITATITMSADVIQWMITIVYGPQGDNERLLFLQELLGIAAPVHGRWLILGDFN